MEIEMNEKTLRDEFEMEWQSLATAPKNGSRIRLGHDLDPSSLKVDTICPTYGKWVDGKWQLESYFLCTNGFMTSTPTCWLLPRSNPIETEGA